MSLRAKYYIGGVLVIGLTLSLTAATTTDPNSGSWTLLAVLATFATGAHLFQVLGPSHEAWNFNLIFYFCGLILLTPAQFVILLIVPHVVEWIKARMGDSNSLRSWYIQPFNVSVHLISAWISRLVLFTFERGAPSLTSTDTLIAISIGAMIYALTQSLAYRPGIGLGARRLVARTRRTRVGKLCTGCCAAAPGIHFGRGLAVQSVAFAACVGAVDSDVSQFVNPEIAERSAD